MSDKFKMRDTYRLSVEADAARIKEATDKVVLEGENKLIGKFLSFYGNGKLASKTKANLRKIEAETSSAVSLDGDVEITAEVIDSNDTKKVSVSLPVKANSIDLPEDEELKKLVSEAEALPRISDTSDDIDQTSDIVADLGQFQVIDNRDGYLHVYHPSLDTGKPLGVISYDEYSDLSNKEAFFVDVLEKQASNPELVNHYKLSLTGSFSEPDVNVVAEVKHEPKVEKVAAKEETTSKDEDNLFLAHQADTYRQQQEFEVQKTQADLNRISNSAANALVRHLQALKYDSVKILSGEFNNDKTSINFTASVTDSKGDKVVSLGVPLKGDSYILPKKEVVAQVISKTADLKSRISEAIDLENRKVLASIDENERWIENETEAALEDESIKKEAGGDVGGVQFIGPVDVLHIDKHTVASLGISEDMQVGDEVDIDGFRWKLTSVDKDALSKEANSGSLWTFSKVTPVSESEDD